MVTYTIPLWYLLIPFGLVLLGTTIFLFFNLYHVAKFGLKSASTTTLLIAYVLSYVVVLGVSAALIGSFDWSAEVSLLEILPFATGSTSSYGL